MTKPQRPVLDGNEPTSTEIEKEEGFLRRWSRLKSEADAYGDVTESRLDEHMPTQDERRVNSLEEKADADMPSLESLNSDSDYSAFLSSKVSEELRRLALRKLFASSKFNLRDGLDDYDEDFRDFKALGDLLTCDMRHRVERALEESQERRDGNLQAEQARQTTENRLESDSTDDAKDSKNIDDHTDEISTGKGSPDEAA